MTTSRRAGGVAGAGRRRPRLRADGDAADDVRRRRARRRRPVRRSAPARCPCSSSSRSRCTSRPRSRPVCWSTASAPAPMLVVSGAAAGRRSAPAGRCDRAAAGRARPSAGRHRRRHRVHRGARAGPALVPGPPGSAADPADDDPRPARPGAVGAAVRARAARRGLVPGVRSAAALAARWWPCSCSPWSGTRPAARWTPAPAVSAREIGAQLRAVWRRPGHPAGLLRPHGHPVLR